MKNFTFRCFFVVMAALAAMSLSRAAYSQQMNFSYYSDIVISPDGQTLYTIIDGYDNSTGCTHYDYQTTGYVSGPSGYFQEYFPGLSSYIGVPAAEGNYSFWSDAFVNCSCFGSGLGAGGGNGAAGRELYRHHYLRTAVGSPSTYTLEANSQNKRCSHSTLTWPSSPSPEPTRMNDEGFYWSFFGNPVACLSVCTAGWDEPALGPSGPTLGPATCG